MVKRIENKVCKVCGKVCNDSHGSFNGITSMCRKHYDQFKKYGRTLDTNPRTVWDPNEIRVMGNYAEIDTYTNTGEVLNTFKLDIEDTPLLQGHKWRTVFKGKRKVPYLVTGHAGSQGTGMLYFHRLVLGNPSEEVDHINRDSTDDRKVNLRISYRQQQLVNTRLRADNTQGVKGIYFIQRDQRYRAEIQKGKVHVFSPMYKTKEEAAYMRLSLEKIFYSKEEGMNNSKELETLALSTTIAQRIPIDSYIQNHLNQWIC